MTTTKNLELLKKELLTNTNNGVEVRFVWRRNSMGYGVAALNEYGEKVAYAGGCGWDKASACLAYVLVGLGCPVGEFAGAGLNMVKAEALKHGFKVLTTPAINSDNFYADVYFVGSKHELLSL